MELRQYQTDVINQLKRVYALGKHTPVLVLPCG